MMCDFFKIYVDMVYCVDLTYNTAQTLNKIKDNMRTIYENLCSKFSFYRHYVIKLRIKVIGYKNCCDKDDLIFDISDFFCIPEETDKLMKFVNAFEIGGDRTVLNNSLEALALAMQSDWCVPTLDCSKIKKMHYIVFFSGTSSKPLEDMSSLDICNFTVNIPKSYEELIDQWYGAGSCCKIDQQCKRLILFAPEESEPWADLADDFDYTYICYTELSDKLLDIDTVINKAIIDFYFEEI